MLAVMARRPLRALQVEVTSRCSRRCVVCPRSALDDQWLEGDLTESRWRRLRPDLRLAAHVHLQGWGEPLLHDRLPAMVRDAHGSGCRVGITTNGDLLDGAAEWIVAEHVELLTVSIAGLGETNRRLRGDAEAEEVLAALAGVRRRRGRRRRPRLQVSVLLTVEGASDLPEVVRAAAHSGVDSVVVNHLDVTPTEELWHRAAYTPHGVPGSALEELSEAVKAAKRRGVAIRLPSVEPREMLTCALDPRRIVSVRWDGRVGPCIQLNLPVAGPVHRWTAEGPVVIEPVVFGHIDEQPLRQILKDAAYRNFVAPLDERCEADRRFQDRGLSPSGWGAVALRELDDAHLDLGRALMEHPFPEACRGCPKVHGW